uniref:Uncharacterized protein n=1 Tax=Avena sativa TaxID=4498 RepID=A0ACD5Z8E9_AVESA
MDYLGIEEILAQHLLKRWTRDARDILPAHLKVYQNDHASSRSFTYRHSTIFRKALELVRLGDASAEAYENLDGLFNDNLVAMAPYNDKRDGLGLEDRTVCQQEAPAIARVQADVIGNSNLEACDLRGICAPPKNRGAGRPTNSRDRALYEPPKGLSKRTRFCSICKCSGHKKTTCPLRGDAPKQPRKEGRCTNCGVAGH